MKIAIVLLLFIFSPFPHLEASNRLDVQHTVLKKKKNGKYKKKKHWLKKMIQGKNYCDCPKQK
jgi:hypothetical protein